MLRMFYEPEQDMHRLRILLAGDGSGNSDIGGEEFTIIFRFGGDSEMFMTGGRGRFGVTVVAAMTPPPLRLLIHRLRISLVLLLRDFWRSDT